MCRILFPILAPRCTVEFDQRPSCSRLLIRSFMSCPARGPCYLRILADVSCVLAVLYPCRPLLDVDLSENVSISCHGSGEISPVRRRSEVVPLPTKRRRILRGHILSRPPWGSSFSRVVRPPPPSSERPRAGGRDTGVLHV